MEKTVAKKMKISKRQFQNCVKAATTTIGIYKFDHKFEIIIGSGEFNSDIHWSKWMFM